MSQQILLRTWEPVTAADEALYAAYFSRSAEPFSYENNWAFISQEVRVSGLKHEGRGMLLTAVSKADDSPFIFILPPSGDTHNFRAQILEAAAALAASSERRVVLRKLPSHLCEQVLQTGRFTVLPPSAFTHPRDVPEDQFPQVVLDVTSTLKMEGSRYRRMRNDLKYFEGQYRPKVVNLTSANVEEVERLIHGWCQEYNRRHALLSDAPESTAVDPSAYTVLARRFAGAIDNSNYFAKLVRVGPSVAAFTLAGRVGPDCAAQYVNLSTLRARGCSEFLVFELLRGLSGAGIAYLNLGGAETEGQFRFKKKFDVHRIKDSFEVEYTP